MKCKDVMQRDVECMEPQQTVVEAAKLMRDSNRSFLAVCDWEHSVIGTVTERDLVVQVLAAGCRPTLSVAEVIGTDLVSCRPDDDLEVAEQLMALHNMTHIVCVDERGHHLGIVTLAAIARYDGDRLATTLIQMSERELRH